MENFEHLFTQQSLFIKGFIPYDFTEGMGQYAVRIDFTNGDFDMLTTPSTLNNVSDKGDLTVEEYFKLIIELKKL